GKRRRAVCRSGESGGIGPGHRPDPTNGAGGAGADCPAGDGLHPTGRKPEGVGASVFPPLETVVGSGAVCRLVDPGTALRRWRRSLLDPEDGGLRRISVFRWHLL